MTTKEYISIKFYDFKDWLRYLPIIRQIWDGWYYTKCFVWKKYNRVHAKTLPPTWCDRDNLMAHIIFQILEDFVKKECSPGIVDWGHDDPHKVARKKMDELLDWWHNTYLKFDEFEGYDETKSTPPNEKKDENGYYTLKLNEYDKSFYLNAGKKEQEMEEELQKKLKEIIDIRPYLWT